MKLRYACLCLLAATSSASTALANGGTVRPNTVNGQMDAAYGFSPVGANDRAITAYNLPSCVVTSEFDPNTVICGARARVGHQSATSANRPLRVDLRLENPATPGCPDVGPDVPIGGAIPCAADSNPSPPQCLTAVSYQLFSFNLGSGVLDPTTPFFLTMKFEPAGGSDGCLLGVELATAPSNGKSMYFTNATGCRPLVIPPGSSSPGTRLVVPGRSPDAGLACDGIPGNHWLEVVTFTPCRVDLRFRMHGSPQFPGDLGQKVWFHRADPAGTCVDDFISATIIVDNCTGAPVSNQTLSVIACRGVINPSLTPKDLASTFRLVSSPKTSLASGNPYSWAPGQTVLEANIPATIAAGVSALLPVNLPFDARITHALTGQVMDEEKDVLGLRRHRGQIDEGTSEAAYLLRSPVVTGDAFAQRFPVRRLMPACGSGIQVTGVDVEASRNGGGGGFDALTLRTADPVLVNAPDLSPTGRLARVGSAGDGTVGVPIPMGACTFSTVSFGAPAPIVPRTTSTDALWVVVNLLPRDTCASGTRLCADTTWPTVLDQSFQSRCFTVPFERDPWLNWMVRLRFDIVP